MPEIDFSTWRNKLANPHNFGKTIKIDGGSYSIEIQSTDDGRGQWLFQRGQYDNQRGRFDKQIRSGIGDTFDDGVNQLMSAIMAYSSYLHDVDLGDWQRNLVSATETYWRIVELGDRDYAVEIRRLSETKSEWRITQGNYDGASDNFDAEIISGKSRTLKDSFVSALDSFENFAPPAPHIF